MERLGVAVLRLESDRAFPFRGAYVGRAAFDGLITHKSKKSRLRSCASSAIEPWYQRHNHRQTTLAERR
jgi:hypothetical protein